MRILIAEDDPAIAAAITASLRQGGHAVDHVTSGAQADAALRDAAHDLLVLDLGLPALDGSEVLHRLRQRGSGMPVLVITAREGLTERVRGVDRAEVAEREEAKSISRDETFDTDLNDDLLLEGELTELVSRAGADLREDGLEARTITVRIRDADFRTRQASRTVDESLASDRALFGVARALLQRLRGDRRVPARLLGIALSNFRAPPPRQLGLFDAPRVPMETPKDRELSRAVDEVRAKFGRGAIAAGRKR